MRIKHQYNNICQVNLRNWVLGVHLIEFQFSGLGAKKRIYYTWYKIVCDG